MKLLYVIAALTALLVAVSVSAGIALSNRAEQIEKLEQSVKNAEASLKIEQGKAAIYRRRTETLQAQNEALQAAAAAGLAVVQNAVAENPDWSRAALPESVAAAVREAAK